MSKAAGNLLCVANFPANTGFAWDFIEGLYARIGNHLASHGIATLVAYPSVNSPPRPLAGSAARAIVLDASLDTRQSMEDTIQLIKRERIRVIYFTDRPARRWAYVRLRMAGVRYVIVHDHSSGVRTRPTGLRRLAKWILSRIPWLVADTIIAVSEFVARRHVEVGVIPPGRVVTVWNGLPELPSRAVSQTCAHETFGVSTDRPLMVCACRAAPEKGVDHLLRAFDRAMEQSCGSGPRPALLYLGDGPQMPELKILRESLRSKDDIILGGYRADAKEMLDSAALCVVPSVWQDAFPLAVLEPMGRGKPVIATRVGGIPEMIEDGVNGLLVPPGDEQALSAAIAALLRDPGYAARLGEAARRYVAKHLNYDRQIARLVQIVEAGLGLSCTQP